MISNCWLQQRQEECVHSIRLNLQNGHVHFFRSHPSKQATHDRLSIHSPLWKICEQGSTQIESASLSSSTSYSHVQMQHAPCVSLLESIPISRNGLYSNFYQHQSFHSSQLASPIRAFRSIAHPTHRLAAAPNEATLHSWDRQGSLPRSAQRNLRPLRSNEFPKSMIHWCPKGWFHRN